MDSVTDCKKKRDAFEKASDEARQFIAMGYEVTIYDWTDNTFKVAASRVVGEDQ